MKNLLEKFNQEYQFLYDHEDNVAGFQEAVDAFDKDLQNAKFKKLVQEFVQYRKDAILSDREAAAFEFCCESLGLLNELGLY